jgi:RNA polymerase sigma-70 factor, ECF subfamily
MFQRNPVDSDADLVRRVLGGDKDAYAGLVRRHERGLLAAAGAVLGDAHAAQDAAQEAFVIAYQKLRALRNGQAFGWWALRIVRRVACRMRGGPGGQWAPCGKALLHEEAEAAAPPRKSPLDEDIREVLRAVSSLPERQRQALLLRFFGGHAVDDISRITSRPAGTVRSHLSRAIARLRERLKDKES